MAGKVSVIMPVYNCEKTLEQAVLSIVGQTYRNIEIIICDDGSTDGTYGLCLNLAKKYDCIRVIKNEKNLGIAKSENRCLSLAKGEFIACMDGDDYAAPDRMEREVNFLLKNPEYSFVSGGMKCFNEDGVFATIYSTKEPTLEQLYKKGGGFCHAAAMFYGDVIRKVGYNERDIFERHEDYELWIRLYRLGYKGYNLPFVFHYYRKDADSYCKHSFKDKARMLRKNIKAHKALGVKKGVFVNFLKDFIIMLIPNRLFGKLHKIYIKKRYRLK